MDLSLGGWWLFPELHFAKERPSTFWWQQSDVVGWVFCSSLVCRGVREVFHAEFCQMRFFHHDKFASFVTLGDDCIFLRSKFCQSRSFETRDKLIWLDGELALLYQVLHVHLESLEGFFPWQGFCVVVLSCQQWRGQVFAKVLLFDDFMSFFIVIISLFSTAPH